MTQRVAALILAAGLSSRMGELKPLLPLGDGNVLESTTASFFKAGVTDIYVVIGHAAARIRDNYKDAGRVHLIYNEVYEAGMLTSVQAGMRAMEEGISAFFMMPADYPLVNQKTIGSLARAFESAAASIIVPTFLGRTGHPCLISLRYREEILGGEFPHGMRTLLQRHEREILYLPVEDEAILWDMDTPDQYERMRQRKAYAAGEMI